MLPNTSSSSNNSNKLQGYVKVQNVGHVLPFVWSSSDKVPTRWSVVHCRAVRRHCTSRQVQSRLHVSRPRMLSALTESRVEELELDLLTALHVAVTDRHIRGGSSRRRRRRRSVIAVVIVYCYYPAPGRYRERGIVFARFLCFFVSLYLCIFVSLSARLRENGYRFAWNFQGRCGVTMGRPDSILGQFGWTGRPKTPQNPQIAQNGDLDN